MESIKISPISGYHDVFFPLTDVYGLSGPRVFQELKNRKEQKNLVVFPMPFADRLEKGEVGGTHRGSGAGDTLEELARITHDTSIPVDHPIEGMTIYSLSDSLHLASIDRPLLSPDPEEFSVGQIEKTIAQYFSCPDNHPTIITARPTLHFKFGGSRGLKVDYPQFLRYGPDTINEGNILGNERLHAVLHTNSGSVSLEEAIDIMGRDLFPHQFLNFEGGDHARVTGDYVFNRSKDRVLRLDNARVVLLPPKEKEMKLKIGSYSSDKILGIEPLDMDQYKALQYGLLNPLVDLVFVCGGAGSGKTILSYVAAVDQVLWYNENIRKQRGTGDKKGGRFQQMVLLKPLDIMGGKSREVGFLPGSLYQKIKNHLGPFEDAHKLSDLGRGIPFESMFLHPVYKNDFGKIRPAEVNNYNINGSAHLPAGIEVIELTYSGFLRGRL